jgi:hypothetical protein
VAGAIFLKLNTEQLTLRAMAAYIRAGHADRPSVDDSDVETVDGFDYCVLRNARGVLAVYRVRDDGMLKDRKRWPTTIH